MNWKKRLVKVIGCFIIGYSGGLGVELPLIAILDPSFLTIGNILLYPGIAGLIVALPQLGKILNEYADFKDN